MGSHLVINQNPPLATDTDLLRKGNIGSHADGHDNAIAVNGFGRDGCVDIIRVSQSSNLVILIHTNRLGVGIEHKLNTFVFKVSLQ